MLRVADRLGRGKGRTRVLDRLNKPPAAKFKPDLNGWETHQLAAAWLGHATILLRLDGQTILTDPVLFNRVGIGLGLITAGPMRLVAPALTVRELPKIDLLLISHAHFDHLDRPTLARLPKDIPVVTAHHVGDLISDLGFKNITELKWGESAQIANLKVTARAVKHWGARTFHDQHRGFNAYLLESPAHRVLYGADSAYQELFKDIGDAGPVDLAILGIGAYDPYVAAHATPEQALAMADHLRAKHILPMHHSTFRLSHEPLHEPMQRLIAAAGDRADRIVIREVGQQWVEEKSNNAH